MVRVRIDEDTWQPVWVLSNYCGEDVDIPRVKLEEIKRVFKKFAEIQHYLDTLQTREKMKKLYWPERI